MSWFSRAVKKVKKKVAPVLGTAWAAPWSGVAFATTLGPLWAARQIAYHSTDKEHAVVRYVARPRTKLSRIYPGHIWGITLGSFQLYSHARAVARLENHENVHTRQAWALGPFFPLMYVGAHFVSLVKEEGNWRDAYEANPFEEDARRRE